MKKVVALGFFDGVHLGHGALLKRTAQVARSQGLTPAALTFDRHPGSVVTGHSVPLLTTTAQRTALMERLYGIEAVIVLPCDGGMLNTPWRDFVTHFLVERHQAAHLVAGADFRFGRFGEGTADKLQALCAQLGLGCDIIPKVELDGITISSTYIRKLLAQGEMERANYFLGHPHTLTDTVHHGKKLGSTLGFPTVNLRFAPGVLVPARGVYATKVHFEDGTSRSAVTNIGSRPTVDSHGEVNAEGFILDFDGDLYGQTIRMEFYRYLRSERKFESLGALRSEVMRNAEQTRQYFEAKGL